LENVLYNGEYQLGNIVTEYVTSIINRSHFINMFGEEGQLRIYNNRRFKSGYYK